MKFGVMFANTGHGSPPSGAIAIAEAAEAGGFDTLWTVEHVVVPSGYESPYPYDASGKMAGGAEVFDLPDPLIWLAFVAARTERIRLGTGVLVLPQRNVVVTAKEIATLDHLSGGRVTLGVGAGWLAEEFAALGVPFEERGARLDEYIDVLRELWAPRDDPEKSTVDGRFVSFTDCIMRPRPTNGTVPIVIGGHTKVAARRAARRGNGFFPAARRSRTWPPPSPRCAPRRSRSAAIRARSSSTRRRAGGRARSSTSASSGWRRWVSPTPSCRRTRPTSWPTSVGRWSRSTPETEIPNFPGRERPSWCILAPCGGWGGTTALRFRPLLPSGLVAVTPGGP